MDRPPSKRVTPAEIIMRALLSSLSVILMLSHGAATFRGVANAQDVHSSRYFPEDAIMEWRGEKFTVQRIDFLDDYSLERENVVSWVNSHPGEIEDLQAALRSNGQFSRALTQQNVQLNNVVAVSKALNGNLIVYLR
jgi:hypothetical protein